MDAQPTIFIGSSSEALDIAEALEFHLHKVMNVDIWDYGIFKIGKSLLESLVNSLDRFDFAIFVLTQDDLVESRGSLKYSPRDNVIFEIGLLIGRIGRERTFIVHEKGIALKLPSDLLGITVKTFQRRTDGNLISS